MAFKFKTIQDMMGAFYGQHGGEVASAILKADAPVLSSTTGVYNRVYGAQAWSLLNNSAKTIGVLPKVPLNTTGFRILTARGTALGSAAGMSETAALPETTKPTIAEVDLSIKTFATTFDTSLVKELLDKGGDDTWDFSQVREEMALEHTKHINKMLHGDVDTLASDNFESIDRVCSSKGEVDNLSLDAGDADIYGLDRDSVTTYDAYVDDNSGTDIALTTGALRLAVDTIEENSGHRPNVIITGFDTARDIDALFETQTRYAMERVTVGINGIQTAAGNDVGMRVKEFDGIPIIRDSDVTKDTKSRIYFLNTEFIEFAVKLPTSYFESNDYFALNKLGREGMYVTIGELRCRNFPAQGKIRDL